MLRRGRDGFIAWQAPRNDSFQTLSVQLGSGQQFGLQPGRHCAVARLKGVPASVSVQVELAGVRSDETAGPSSSLALRAKQARAGARGAVPRSACI